MELTENAVRVAASMFASLPTSGEDRMRTSGLARSSYRVAKRRLYDEGVLEDRYVPSPSAVGVLVATFLVVRPFTDRIPQVARALAKSTGAVVVLAGSQVVAATLFHQSPRDRETLKGRLNGGELGSVIIDVATNPDRAQVPVYYDFEGLWSNFADLPGTVQYPRPLPVAAESPAHLLRSSEKMAGPMGELLCRPFGGRDTGRPKHLVGPDGLPRSQRRLLRRGLAEWRVMLNLSACPSYRGRSISHLILTRGALKVEGGLPALFSTMTAESRVAPFLLASDGNGVLIGTLGTGLDSPPGLAGSGGASRTVLPVLARHLDGIEVVREPLASLNVLLWHQYDRLGACSTTGFR